MPRRRNLALGLAVVTVATLTVLTAGAVRSRGASLRAKLPAPRRPPGGPYPLLELANRGETLVIGSGNHAEIWALDRGAPALVHTYDWAMGTHVLFATDADRALVHHRSDGDLDLVCVTTGDVVSHFTWPELGLRFALSPSGALVAAHIGSAVEVRATRTGALVRTLELPRGILTNPTEVYNCELAPGEDRVLLKKYVGSSETYEKYATWSVADARLLGTVAGRILGFTRSGDLFGWANGGDLAVWTPAGEKLRTVFECSPDELPQGGLHVPRGGPPYRIESGRRGRTLLEGLPSEPILSSDGRRAVLQRGGEIEVWDLDP